MSQWVVFSLNSEDCVAYTEIDLNGSRRVVYNQASFVADIHWEGVVGIPFPYIRGSWPTQRELDMLEMIELRVYEKVGAIMKHVEYTRLLDVHLKESQQ